MAAQPALPVGAVLYKKDPNYYSPPVTANSISGKKKSTQLYRVDGLYLQCGWPGCLFAAKDLHIAAGPKHFKEGHGYRDAILPSQDIRHSAVIPIDKATFDAGMRARKAQKQEKMQASRQPGYVPVPDPVPARLLAQVQQAQAAGPQQQAPPNPPAQPAAGGDEDADGEQATWTRFVCYVCRRTYGTLQDTKNHMREFHERQLLTEPLQPDRIVQAECHRGTDRVIKLLGGFAFQQLPTFDHIATELQELILQQLITVPTYFFDTLGAIDRNIFKAFLFDPEFRDDAKELFTKYNFVIQLNVTTQFPRYWAEFERHMPQDLPIVPPKWSRHLAKPALTIDVDLDQGPVSIASGGVYSGRKTEQTCHTFTLVYTQKGIVDLLGTLQLSNQVIKEVSITVADYANDQRYGETMQIIRFYVGFLRGVENITYHESGQLTSDDQWSTLRGSHLREDVYTIYHWRHLVITLEIQLEYGWNDLASMTAHWLRNYTALNGWKVRLFENATMRTPNGTPQELQRLRQAKLEVSEMDSVLQLELATTLFMEVLPFRGTNKFPVMLEYMRLIYSTRFLPLVLQFPGIPDELRARADVAQANYHQALALWQLYIARDCGRVTRFENYLDDNLPHDDLYPEGHIPKLLSTRRSDEGNLEMEEDTEMTGTADRVADDADSIMSNDAVPPPPSRDDLFFWHPTSTMVKHAVEALSHLGNAITVYQSALNMTDVAKKYQEQFESLSREFGHELDPAYDNMPALELHTFTVPGSVFGGTWLGDLSRYPAWFNKEWGASDPLFWAQFASFRERPDGWDEGLLEIQDDVEKQLARLMEKNEVDYEDGSESGGEDEVSNL